MFLLFSRVDFVSICINTLNSKSLNTEIKSYNRRKQEQEHMKEKSEEKRRE